MIRLFSEFWDHHPALFLGIVIFLGISCWISFSWFLILPISLILFTCGRFDRLCICITLLCLSYGYTHINYLIPPVSENGISGEATITISNVSLKTTPFGKQWSYHGKILAFVPEDELVSIAKNIDYSLNIPAKEGIRRPLANQNYRLKSILRKTKSENFYLKVSQNSPWNSIIGTWSLAEFRLGAKQFVASAIQNNYQSNRSASFLTGIATGDFDDRAMSTEFSRFGLQHIMAISGFHFAIIAGILSALLRPFMSKKLRTLFLIGLLTSYFVFLGCGPSILRSWLAILIALIGFLFRRQGSGLNSLGIAMIIIMIIDPFLCTHIGFQFSFLTTTAILLFFGCIDAWNQALFFKRSLGITTRMHWMDQHGYCFLSAVRQALSLGIAVNLIAMPLTLLYFQKFPFLSFVYNLFFPFLVSLSMLFLISGFLTPFFGKFIHLMNDYYTTIVLNFTHQMPRKLDFTFTTSVVTSEFIIIYLSVIFILGIGMYQIRSRNSSPEFLFI